MFEGKVDSIFIATAAAVPMTPLDEVTAVAGRGLEGDRYFNKEGTWSKNDGPKRQVTLIELEAIEGAARDHEVELDKTETRRNIVTVGVPLNHLVGERFTVGDVELRGVSLCEPCKHIEKLSAKGIRKPLVHRGGLNAEVLRDGVIRAGDRVSLLPT